MHSKLRIIQHSYITPSLISQNHGEMNVLSLNLISNDHFSFSYITCFDININHQTIQSTCSHTSRCDHCNRCHYWINDFVLFHDITCCANFFLSHIHVNAAKFHSITWTLVATNVVLQGLECTSVWYVYTCISINTIILSTHVSL